MIEEKTKENILMAIAPCSMFCSTCTGCRYGEVSYRTKELLKLLDGHEEFLEKNLKEEYSYKLEEFKIFRKKLAKYAHPKCGGCRFDKSTLCCIANCPIPACVKEHEVDFCADCKEFPCSKINGNTFKKETIAKWLNAIKRLKKSA